MVAEQLSRVRSAMDSTAKAAGRDPASVKLVAVSKKRAPEVIREAYDAGQRRFGENRVQDMCDKAGHLPADCEWHFIGPLQKNKVRHAVRAADWIHTLDSVALVERVNRIAGEEKRTLSVLVQVNISGEESKHGCTPEEALPVVQAVLRSPQLQAQGFMTMAPYMASEAELQAIFKRLRVLRDDIESAAGTALPELSMGMSGDFPQAIAEGATIVRVGTAIFGAR